MYIYRNTPPLSHTDLCSPLILKELMHTSLAFVRALKRSGAQRYFRSI